MLWGGLELAAKGPDLGEDSLGKQSRRKSIVQPFSIFYSLALHRGVAGGGIDLRGPPAASQRRTGARRGAIAATDHSDWQSAGLGLGVHTRQSSPKHPFHQCGNTSTVFGVWEELQPCAGLIICTKAGKHATIVHRRALST